MRDTRSFTSQAKKLLLREHGPRLISRPRRLRLKLLFDFWLRGGNNVRLGLFLGFGSLRHYRTNDLARPWIVPGRIRLLLTEGGHEHWQHHSGGESAHSGEFHGGFLLEGRFFAGPAINHAFA